MKFSCIIIHLSIVGIFQLYFVLADDINVNIVGDDNDDDDDDDDETPPELVRFNKFGVLDNRFQGLPFVPASYPVSENEDVFRFLTEGTDAESVVNDKTDVEVIYNVEELIGIVGGLPDHPSSDDNAEYWNKLNRVINMRNRKGSDSASTALENQMQLPLRWENFTVNDVAEAVYDEYPGEHQADFLFDLIGGKYGELLFDDSIIPRRSEGRFWHGIIMLADLNTWSMGIVGPHNFGAKWFAGRARPEEISWLIRTGEVNAPRKIRNKLRKIRNYDQATDFTRYSREGRSGSPRHPSWPAMHSAGSNMSFWTQIVFNLTPRQRCEAKKVDFAVSFARTVAGVHFEDDNLAGLNMGQEIVARSLPNHFAQKYGSGVSNVRRKVNEKRFQWGNHEKLQDCDSL